MRARSGARRAWLDSLDGAGREFYGYDVRRPVPYTHRRDDILAMLRAVSGDPFDGTSATWTTNAGRDEITIGDNAGDELPLGFQLIEGDYVGLQWQNEDTAQRRSLHRVLAPFAADAGGVAILSIRPVINVDVPADAVVNFIKPSCLMAVTKRDRSAEHKDRRVSFEAVQNLEFP